MKIFLSLLFTLTLGIAHSQLGVQIASTYNSIPGWQIAFENGLTGKHSPFMRYGSMISFRYQMDLHTEGFYLAPAIAIDRNTQDFHFHHFELIGYNLGGILGYRFLTIKKDEAAAHQSFSAGIELSAGAGYMAMRYNRPLFSDGEYTGEQEQFSHNLLAASFGTHLSTKIFVSEKLGFGPMLSIRYVPHLNWSALPSLIDPELPSSLGNTHLFQWTAGVLMHWHFAN